MMDLRALRYFRAVAECGSISRAADQLRISQPSVSRAVRQLEEELRRPLLRRTGHGVIVTEPGRVLLEHSQFLLRQVEEARIAVERVDSTPARPPITLALPPGAGQLIAPLLLGRLADQGPLLSLKIVSGYSSHVNEWIARGQIDVACLHEPVCQRDQWTVNLSAEEVVVVGKKGSFPRSRDYVTPEDLIELPMILPSRPNASRRLLDSWNIQRGLSLDASIEVDDHVIMTTLVKQGLGFTLLTRPSLVFDPEGRDIDVRELRPRATWQLAMLGQNGVVNEPLIHLLVDRIQECIRDLKRSTRWHFLGKKSGRR